MSTFKSRLLHFFMLACLLAALLAGPALAAPGDTTLISRANSPRLIQADGSSDQSSISADGRFVAFRSYASTLVGGDTNEQRDIFVFDNQTGLVERVSLGPSGMEANFWSDAPSISGDGRYVAFQSGASNLVSGDVNMYPDIFVFDRQTGLTERVSVDSSGIEANYFSYDPSISGDGRYVAFKTVANNLVNGDTNSSDDILVHDRQTGVTERVSLGPGAVQANDYSYAPSISSDGRYVAFVSIATNLVSDDTNDMEDIFVHDRQTGLTERVSVGPGAVQANDSSHEPSISADGRYVAFLSYASNLVSSDTNDMEDIFVHDRQTGQTERVSVDSSGVQANDASYSPSISSDGRYVAFQSAATNLVSGDTNDTSDIFVFDRQTGLTERVTLDSSGVQANGYSSYPSISDGGRYVAFESHADNLVSGDTNNEVADTDIFVFDREESAIERASTGPVSMGANSSSFAPSISTDGRFVAFHSLASNLVSGDTNRNDDIFVFDRQSSVTERVSVDSSGVEANSDSRYPSISADGRFVAFRSKADNLVSDDWNYTDDIFVHDRQTGQTERVSVASSGAEGNEASLAASISTNGRYVAFISYASNLVSGDTNEKTDIFVRDRQTGETERVSLGPGGVEGNFDSDSPSISADGRYVAFSSAASNLVSSDTNGKADSFVYDRQTRVTERVSVDSSGGEANNSSSAPSLSTDGRFVAFVSYASNLVSGDTNGAEDIFVFDRQTGVTERVSLGPSGVQANFRSNNSSISADGRFVAFSSAASNLVSGDTNGKADIFIHDRQTGLTERVSLDSSGEEANDESGTPSISADGRYVAFVSYASNLVSADVNATYDIFLHELEYEAPVGTSTTVSCTNPIAYGSSTTCTATVTRASSGYMPGGSVSWTSADGGSFAGSPCSLSGTGGSATCSVTYTPSAVGDGLHQITATYGGDAHFSGSSGSQTITINTKALVPGITASNKLYDRTTAATILTRTLSGVVGGDAVSLTGGSATFNNKNVGNGKTVTGSGFSLSGAKAGNYHLSPTTATTTANITTRSLTVSAAGVDKIYDGTTTATVTLSTNALAGDVVSAAYTSASFANPGAGTGKTVNVGGLSISGADAGNYTLSNTTASTTAAITPKPVTVTAENKAKLVGEPDPIFTYTSSGFVGSDAFTTLPSCSVAGDHDEPGMYDIVCAGGAAGPNYTLGYVKGTLTVSNPVCYTLTLSHTGQGSDPVGSPANSTGCPAGKYMVGARIDLSGAVPESGWQIGGWNGTEDDASTASTNTIRMPAGDHAASVIYLNNPLTVVSVTRAGVDPTSASSVQYTVTFSAAVTGVDASDFILTKTGSISGYAITGVFPTTDPADSYTVSVATGNYNGTLRLDLLDNDSIKNGGNTPLGGPGNGNGDFTSGEAYTVTKQYTSNLNSIAAQDGWMLESGETNNKGGTLNKAAITFFLGDNAQKKQYRTILSFSTKGLPDEAVITKVTLKVKRQGVVGGGNPVNTFQGFMVDIKKGFFGSAAGLQASDFQAKANNSYGPFKPALKNGWYAINLISALADINTLPTAGGVTQVRLRFKLDDNNNTIANYLSLYSGNAPVASRPQLIIEYHVP